MTSIQRVVSIGAHSLDAELMGGPLILKYARQGAHQMCIRDSSHSLKISYFIPHTICALVYLYYAQNNYLSIETAHVNYFIWLTSLQFHPNEKFLPSSTINSKFLNKPDSHDLPALFLFHLVSSTALPCLLYTSFIHCLFIHLVVLHPHLGNRITGVL